MDRRRGPPPRPGESESPGLAGRNRSRDHALGALIYVFATGVAPYVSYSESFTPIAGTNLAGERWVRMRGEQREIGVKWEPPGKRIAANVAAFELEEKKRQVPDPGNPLDQVQVGHMVTRGVEVEVVGRLLPGLVIAAHYHRQGLRDHLARTRRLLVGHAAHRDRERPLSFLTVDVGSDGKPVC
jgi:outer membrane receptor for ferric coprogen and ferric-rhodotorulic acid